MISGSSTSTPSRLSLEDTLRLANEQLENVPKAENHQIKLQLCNDANNSLLNAEKIFNSKSKSNTINHGADDGIADAYHKLGMTLDGLGYHDKARKSYDKATEWGYVHVVAKSLNSQGGSVTNPINISVATTISSAATQSASSKVSSKTIFSKDVSRPTMKYILPESDGRFKCTPQLAYSISLLPPLLVTEEYLEEKERQWFQEKLGDPEEQKRLRALATDIIREFLGNEYKDQHSVSEVVCLAAVIDQSEYRSLLSSFVDGLKKSVLLQTHFLDGLAHLITNAPPESLTADDLVAILGLLNERLKDTFSESTRHIHQIAFAMSRVLDSMVDSQVSGLNRENLHEPLTEYLKGLQESSDPSLVYRASYTYQALQYVPNDETILQSMMRRTGKVVQGISGMVSAVKSFDVGEFIDGLKSLQDGLGDISGTFEFIHDTGASVLGLYDSGQGLIDSLKEGFRIDRKSAWYPALRGLDALLRDGKLCEFERLIRESPCRYNPLFRWGVSQRLGELAFSTQWDIETRHLAILLLGDLYKDDEKQSQLIQIKPWIQYILARLAESDDATIAHQATVILQELNFSNTSADQPIDQANPKDNISYIFSKTTQLLSSPLLDAVQNIPDVESTILNLRSSRLKSRSGDVYISPMAKANIKATEDFDLRLKMQEFIESEKKVFLVLGDSGAGKSTFGKELELDLWDQYNNSDKKIPLLIYLPSISKPETDLVGEHLKVLGFSDDQIRELKLNREFILICDGYDEIQETRNLYSSNQLNQPGGWKCQMVISCRTEYTGADYKDCFQPLGSDGFGIVRQYQEVVIAPFNKEQIQDYITQFTSTGVSTWGADDYQYAFKSIRNLQDLVTNPFLLKLALDALPRIVDAKKDLSTTQISRIQLYDEFVLHWVERNHKRLQEMELSPLDQEHYMTLSGLVFKQQGLRYLKELSAAIYDHQNGAPMITYTGLSDLDKWKEAFFNPQGERSLLQEVIPLTRNGTQYRFIHRSILEYGVTLSIFDPNENHEPEMEPEPTVNLSRRGSASSLGSLDLDHSPAAGNVPLDRELLDSILGRRFFVNESPILRFLVERVHQQPLLKKNFYKLIERSKLDKHARFAAANAITVLNQAGEQFNNADLCNIKIPMADLSNGVFDSAQLLRADLRRVNFRKAWLRSADLSEAQMKDAQFGELPLLQETSSVQSAAYSPDGNFYASGLENGNISLYNTLTWERIWLLQGHESYITSLVFSPLSNQLISGSWDQTARVWDVESGTCTHCLECHNNSAIPNKVQCVVYSPRGDCVATGSNKGIIRLWDTETGKCIHDLKGSTAPILFGIAFSPNGDLLASSGMREVLVWNTNTGKLFRTLNGHTDGTNSLAFSPKGDQLVSGGHDYKIRLWDIETGETVQILEGHERCVTKLLFSPKGDQLASASDDSVVRLWNIESGEAIHVLEGHIQRITSIAYSPKGDYLATASGDRTIRLWDVESGTTTQTLEGHRAFPTTISFSPQGKILASGGTDSVVRLWKVQENHGNQALEVRGDWVNSVVYSPQGNQILTGSYDGLVNLWDVETGRVVTTFNGHKENVTGVAFSSNNEQIISSSWDSTVRLWNIKNKDCISTSQFRTRRVTSVAFSPNSDQAAYGTHCALSIFPNNKQDNGAVRIWDIATGDIISTLQGHKEHVTSIAYSPQGDSIVSTSEDKTIILWDIENEEILQKFVGHKGFVYSASFSPDGERIISGSKDKTVRIWDVEDGECIQTLEGHEDCVSCVAYSPNGELIASGSWDRTIQIWDANDGQHLLTISGFGKVYCLAWMQSDGGEFYLATGGHDKSLRHWKIIKGIDGYKAVLCWSSYHPELTLNGASFEGVTDLSGTDWMLLKQRGVSTSSAAAQLSKDNAKKN
ncbi:hypothetical protein BGZ76_007195 [Entomortierella beljakovae]|nr:hypothetical protein BGZ76_007195 [Entomortierella beljakovae]